VNFYSLIFCNKNESSCVNGSEWLLDLVNKIVCVWEDVNLKRIDLKMLKKFCLSYLSGAEKKSMRMNGALSHA
jgi:hypothetical protein